MGIGRDGYFRLFDRVNLLYKFHGRTGRDDRFPRGLARVAASSIRPLLAGRDVVLIGRNVAMAFGLEDMNWHEWVEVEVRKPLPKSQPVYTARMAVVPHPSGRNHWYNNGENRQLAADFWRAHIEDVRKMLSSVPT